MKLSLNPCQMPHLRRTEDEGFSGLDDTKEEKEEEGNVSKEEPKEEEEKAA